MTFTYRVLLKPSDICFKNNFLPSAFDNGIPLQETLQQLVNEEMLLEDLPAIDVVWCQKQWVWYTLNNRRLWVFRELEKLGKCQYIATKRVETIELTTDILLYGSAELIGESDSDIVEWDDDVFDNGEISVNEATTPTGDPKEPKTTTESKEDGKIRRDWRELTPLTVTVRWDQAGKQSDADDEGMMVSLDPNKQAGRSSRAESEESKRERKDSGYSEISSGRTSPRDNNSCSESESNDNASSQDRKPSSRRFSRFHRDRPSLDPHPSTSRSYTRSSRVTTPRAKYPSTRIRRSIKPRRKRASRPQVRTSLRPVTFRRRETYDSMMFLLHHGGKSRLEQLRLKTQLMNTCGFCFKSFRAGVSLSQHIEELKHWACTRCGKYFESYTALGQHKLALDHCNVY